MYPATSVMPARGQHARCTDFTPQGTVLEYARCKGSTILIVCIEAPVNQWRLAVGDTTAAANVSAAAVSRGTGPVWHWRRRSSMFMGAQPSRQNRSNRRTWRHTSHSAINITLSISAVKPQLERCKKTIERVRAPQNRHSFSSFYARQSSQ